MDYRLLLLRFLALIAAAVVLPALACYVYLLSYAPAMTMHEILDFYLSYPYPGVIGIIVALGSIAIVLDAT